MTEQQQQQASQQALDLQAAQILRSMGSTDLASLVQRQGLAAAMQASTESSGQPAGFSASQQASPLSPPFHPGVHVNAHGTRRWLDVPSEGKRVLSLCGWLARGRVDTLSLGAISILTRVSSAYRNPIRLTWYSWRQNLKANRKALSSLEMHSQPPSDSP